MSNGARVLRYIAFGLVVVFAVLGGGFIVGETLTEPGGVSGGLLTAAWVVPMVVLAAYALRRPEPAARVLAVVAVVVASFVVLDAVLDIVPRDEIGPVGSIAVFATAVALGFLGLRRQVRAGWLLLLVGAANLAGAVVTAFGAADGGPPGAGLGGSSGAVAIPVLVIGGLFLVSGLAARTPAAHRVPTAA
jgi:hypothetical protein